ncbi:MAG: sigma-70 family RNA polymerase sigma factor [Ruminococcus sp.]|nr:sigma-70 family RNA polymerase sigma factor [Ruminococcus sp.]
MGRSLAEVLRFVPPKEEDEEAFLLSWQQEALEKLKTIISERLTWRQKEVIMLYYYEGLSQKEIAKRMGISESGVSHLKRRACKRLEYDLKLIRR